MALPLAARHRALGATWGEVAGVGVPAGYGPVEAEVWRARRGAALSDLSFRPRIRVEGPDAVAFLHNLLACDVKSVAAGSGCYGALLNPRGKMVADLHLLRDEGGFWLDVEPEAAGVQGYLQARVLNSKVAVASAAMGHLHLQGPKASELLSRLGAGAPGREHGHFLAAIAGADVRVVRLSRYGPEGFDLLAPEAGVEAVWEALRRAGAHPAGWLALEALRVESGIPRFGAEMDGETFPQEVRIDDRAISFTKGCYPGQETMARLRNLGRVNRRLVGLLPEAPVEPGARLFLDGKEVGRVTSACLSPTLGRPAALAVVRTEAANAGTELLTGSGPKAIVADPPLVPVRTAVVPPGRGAP